MARHFQSTLTAAGAVFWFAAVVLRGQSPAAVAPSTPDRITAEPSGQIATLTFFNRPIVALRARVLGRGPAERAESATHVLDDLVSQSITGPIEWRSFQGAALVTVGGRGVVAITSADVDELSGETAEEVATQTVGRLRRALDDAATARAPALFLRSAALAAIGLLVGAGLLWAIGRVHRTVANHLVAAAERAVARSQIADLEALRASRLLDVERWLFTTIAVVLDLVVVYATVTFVLRRFPYSRPWGESMRSFLISTGENIGLGMINGVPGVFTAIVIFLIARAAVRLIAVWFTAIEEGRMKIRWIYPETAMPTRRLVSALVWAFAVVLAYPYLPGSQTEAFKGVSVLLGLMVTLGSSGFVNQIMSGFMITYSRALRVGDYVRIGEVEGTVIHVGALSTKVKTPRNEEITIPNALVASHMTTDYSRGEADGVYTPTSVTIGYDAPWRQVQALLLAAADRTPGIRAEPKPIVVQAALEDFYVKYVLLVSVERQNMRALTLHALHAHIQDLFNEYGVQIMSPHYEMDPAAPKVVARKNWFAAPARDAPQRTGT